MPAEDYFDEFDTRGDEEFDERRPVRCRNCGSTDVRWRQQGGKWVLFSTQPGVEHKCPPNTNASDFD